MLKKMGFDIHSVWLQNDMLGSMWSRNKQMWSRNCFCSFCYVDSIFACFYLTGQLKSILQNFRLAGVVLVVLNPHVFNLTGQLESKPPEFPTLAATDPQYEFSPPFGSYVETCTSFYVFSGPKKLSSWVCYWTPTQLHHRLSTSHCWMPLPPHH
jgi:hypothetical protein